MGKYRAARGCMTFVSPITLMPHMILLPHMALAPHIIMLPHMALAPHIIMLPRMTLVPHMILMPCMTLMPHMTLMLYMTCCQVEDKTVAGLLALIEAERNGETVDKALLKHLVRMFTSLGTYAGSFEEPFLAKTTQYYRQEGQQYMQESDVAEYLLHSEVRLSCTAFTVMIAYMPRLWELQCRVVVIELEHEELILLHGKLY